MTVKDVKLFDEILEFTITDSLRNMDSKLEFSLSEDQLSGISTSIGSRVKQYKHWYLSRENVQNQLDLEALDLLIQNFQSDILEKNYVDAAIAHYKRYGKLIGSVYLPEEEYLNGTGYNLLNDQKTDKALEVFELANTLYPESVNTYDSYGEALAIDGQKEKAIEILSQGYELAKRTGDPALGFIESNLEKLKEGELRNSPANIPAPPPPPQ
jgi:tetratricopeptide (TPR) repeat protein